MDLIIQKGFIYSVNLKVGILNLILSGWTVKEDTEQCKQIQCETHHHCTTQWQQDSLQSQTETSRAGDTDCDL
ncbi:hypothetical protein M9458_005308, partial [Cirrhinus mrigala]